MLPHYSALKVAEQFNILESLHPGRIDLGLGRAPGTDGITSLALQRNRRVPAIDDYADQIAELLAWFDDSFPESHPFRRVTLSPRPSAPPEVWLLTSSGWSARAAATFGVGIAFAHFISPDGGPEAIAQYRRDFSPRRDEDRPRTAVAIGVICAETDDEANRLASSSRLWRYRQRHLNIRGPVPSVEEALADPHDEPENLLGRGISRAIVGSPEHARDEIEALARLYDVDEVIVVTITYDHGARRRSYELLADVFDLDRPGGAVASARAEPATV
jgi:luciferase family oxidoreductase group 1